MNKKSIEIYCDLIVELKYRIECIDKILDKKIPLRMKIAEEICYLQLRMICELIAIGCLIINEEISSKKSYLLKTYKTDWIISQMTRLHPNFFLTPLENEDSKEDPPQRVHKKIGFLTKEDLATLWNKHAGSHLHRGSARNILNNDKKMNSTT
jgi:hypothetical protein